MSTIATIEALHRRFSSQQAYFNEHSYPSYQQRVSDLTKLKALVLQNQDRIISALSDDFGHRCQDDTLIGDVLTTVSSINYQLKHLKQWMKPVKKHVSLLFQPAKAKVLYQPKGVIGIVSPWNYPVFLSLGPLATAIAAGNTAMIKMSEHTPKTNELLARLLSTSFKQEQVSVVVGEQDMSQAFSELTFDHLFFTGSTHVGGLVLQAAAKNLVPVTLELGGKSPAIIADDMPIDVAVERFILGKTLNSGQTCVAPDYIFCPKGKREELVEALQKIYAKLYQETSYQRDTTSIVNAAQHERLHGLLADAQRKGAKVMPLATGHARQMPLTLLLDVSDDMSVMQQEIFGPILPILEYENIDEAIAYIKDKERPLALYIFSFDKKLTEQIIYNTHAGGVCVNEAAFHVAVDDLPFGGIGHSGMGNYHGKEGFTTFSHAKSILSRGKLSLAPLLFPPFGSAIHKLVYKLFIR